MLGWLKGRNKYITLSLECPWRARISYFIFPCASSWTAREFEVLSFPSLPIFSGYWATGISGKAPPSPKSCTKSYYKQNSGTWNARSLNRSDALTTAARELARYKLGLVCVTGGHVEQGGYGKSRKLYFFLWERKRKSSIGNRIFIHQSISS